MHTPCLPSITTLCILYIWGKTDYSIFLPIDLVVYIWILLTLYFCLKHSTQLYLLTPLWTATHPLWTFSIIISLYKAILGSHCPVSIISPSIKPLTQDLYFSNEVSLFYPELQEFINLSQSSTVIFTPQRFIPLFTYIYCL